MAAFSPKSFLAAYSPAVGQALIERGYTVGELASRSDIPTLEAVATEFSRSLAVEWATLQIYKIEEAGAVCLSTDAKEANRIRRAAAGMIFSLYKTWNLAELSLFFARYLVGEFDEAARDVQGASKIYVALKTFSIVRAADVRRVERERASREYLQKWEENNARACSYEEYIKSKNDGAA